MEEGGKFKASEGSLLEKWLGTTEDVGAGQGAPEGESGWVSRAVRKCLQPMRLPSIQRAS